jgi:hypothetical protein
MAGLLDLLQSASNTAASNVSAPVDGIAWLLRKAGIPVPQAPLGGSDWMQAQGLTRPVEQSGMSLTGETLGLLAPVVAAAKAPQIAQGLLTLGENAASPTERGMIGSQRGALSAKLDDYVGQHRAPMKDSGAPLHNVAKDVYPADFYGPNGLRYYGTGEPTMDAESYSIISRMKDKPDRPVTIYRAVPHDPTVSQQIANIEKLKAKFMARGIVPSEFGGSRTSLGDGDGFYKWATSELDRLKALPVVAKEATPKINNGDWVTINRQYAKEHGQGALGGNYKIISKSVPARKLFTNGDSLHEFGYDESGNATLGALGLLGIGTGAMVYAGQKEGK